MPSKLENYYCWWIYYNWQESYTIDQDASADGSDTVVDEDIATVEENTAANEGVANILCMLLVGNAANISKEAALLQFSFPVWTSCMNYKDIPCRLYGLSYGW